MAETPLTPLTASAMSRPTEDEQAAFTRALLSVAEDRFPPMSVVADLVLMVQRLITEDRTGEAEAKLAAIGELNARPGWLTPADVQRKIAAIISGGEAADRG